ncbi:hypothetical protein METHB2_560007 [Candidatus Methylobacter favarea]|uniref:Uncharacterized protein n=1 Tax=Candidatus Methylobacter favarea TaxID=2707345 RepID=A0A8S0X996_9GAMM|nr:hypothetical protein METHB2_560007 [Candidatus Methylobacter favarea]
MSQFFDDTSFSLAGLDFKSIAKIGPLTIQASPVGRVIKAIGLI